MCARIKAISISQKKGTKKYNIRVATLIQNYGILNDSHFGTGNRQISLLGIESIQKMKDIGLDVAPGDFAENITTEGISLTKLRIGTRLKLGKDVIIEITQIGKECHNRCEIFYQAGDCVMPKEGIFAKVLLEGVIKINDKVEVLDV